MRVKLFWESSSLLKNRPLRKHFKVGNNQKLHGLRSGLYAGCTITSMSCRSSYSWTRWVVCKCVLSWWSIHCPTSSGRFCLICPNNFSNTDFFLHVCPSFFYTFVCSSPLYILPMPLLPPSSRGDACPVGVGELFFTRLSISQLVFHVRRWSSACWMHDLWKTSALQELRLVAPLVHKTTTITFIGTTFVETNN